MKEAGVGDDGYVDGISNGIGGCGCVCCVGGVDGGGGVGCVVDSCGCVDGGGSGGSVDGGWRWLC